MLLMLLIIIVNDCSTAQVNSNILSKENLVSDTRELIKILEESHPDPYLNFGGKIAFHRSFQEILFSIPENGMPVEEYYGMILPFVAKIGDMHTGLISVAKLEHNEPGLPLQLKIVGQDLVVTGVKSDEFRELLGSRLLSVCGLSVDELRKRQTRLRGIENIYGELVFLSISLKTASGIKRLIPEWDVLDIMKTEFRLPSGKTTELNIQSVPAKTEIQFFVPSKLVKPSTAKSDVVYGFLDDNKQNALLIISNMERYREACEAWFSDGMQEAAELTAIAYKHFNNTEPPSDRESLLEGVPSATEIFISMIDEMKKYQTKNLIVDLRDNTGGNSLMKEILIYFLFGKNGLMSTNQGYQIKKYSNLYFRQYAADSLSLINKHRSIVLTKDDYDFSQEKRFEENNYDFSRIEDMLKVCSSFWSVYETGKYDLPSITLKNIIVLCSPLTTSSGFNLLTDLYAKGAKILGTASAQPGNNYGDILFFELENSRLKGYVSFKQNITFPDDPVKGKCLMPDYPLTYKKFESLGFDPDAEIVYALEVLGATKNKK